MFLPQANKIKVIILGVPTWHYQHLVLCYSQGFPVPPKFHHLVLHKQLSCLENSSLLISLLRLTTQPPQTFYNYILFGILSSFILSYTPHFPLTCSPRIPSHHQLPPQYFILLSKRSFTNTIYICKVYLSSTAQKLNRRSMYQRPLDFCIELPAWIVLCI